jgi:acyl-CoA thioesterase-2
VTDSPDAAASDPVGRFLQTLQLRGGEARTTEDIFVGRSEPMPSGRVFGGQVLGQAVIAAERTVPYGRAAHSMHGYFLRPGDATRDITFSVDRIHDGRSFSARRTQAYQEGEPIFSMIASFQAEGAGLDHAAAMPEGIPGPDDVAPLHPSAGAQHPLSRRLLDDRPVEVRHVLPDIYLRPDAEPRPTNIAWVRTRRALPDDPALHRAAIAYISDITIQEPIMRAHGIEWVRAGLKLASLDSALWWHRPARVDEWLLYVQESPSASGGRGLATGRMYTRDGMLVASVAQEVVIRVP